MKYKISFGLPVLCSVKVVFSIYHYKLPLDLQEYTGTVNTINKTITNCYYKFEKHCMNNLRVITHNL